MHVWENVWENYIFFVVPKKNNPEKPKVSGVFVELVSRFGLPTSSLPMKCSTY